MSTRHSVLRQVLRQVTTFWRSSARYVRARSLLSLLIILSTISASAGACAGTRTSTESPRRIQYTALEVTQAFRANGFKLRQVIIANMPGPLFFAVSTTAFNISAVVVKNRATL